MLGPVAEIPLSATRQQLIKMEMAYALLGNVYGEADCRGAGLVNIYELVRPAIGKTVARIEFGR